MEFDEAKSGTWKNLGSGGTVLRHGVRLGYGQGDERRVTGPSKPPSLSIDFLDQLTNSTT